MPDEQNSAILNLLANQNTLLGKIQTNLAINTTKTGFIEQHLRTLNGKVLKQEEKQQQADRERGTLLVDVNDLKTMKRRWSDRWYGLLKQIGMFGLGLLSAYIAFRFFN